jgi:hypothetical protein
MYVCTCVCMYVSLDPQRCAAQQTPHLCMYVRMYVCMYIRMYACMNHYICIYAIWSNTCATAAAFMDVCMYVCVCVCMYVCIIRMYVCMYVCMYVYIRMYVCMYACMYVCMYVCIIIYNYIYIYICNLEQHLRNRRRVLVPGSSCLSAHLYYTSLYYVYVKL